MPCGGAHTWGRVKSTAKTTDEPFSHADRPQSRRRKHTTCTYHMHSKRLSGPRAKGLCTPRGRGLGFLQVGLLSLPQSSFPCCLFCKLRPEARGGSAFWAHGGSTPPRPTKFVGYFADSVLGVRNRRKNTRNRQAASQVSQKLTYDDLVTARRRSILADLRRCRPAFSSVVSQIVGNVKKTHIKNDLRRRRSKKKLLSRRFQKCGRLF